LLIHSWLGGAPKVEIEDSSELFGRRQHHELAAILESATLDDAVKKVGLQPWNNVLEVRCVENTSEHATAFLAFLRHGSFVLHVATSGWQHLQSRVYQIAFAEM
jgi:hypothetical protein